MCPRSFSNNLQKSLTSNIQQSATSPKTLEAIGAVARLEVALWVAEEERWADEYYFSINIVNTTSE